MKSIILAAVLSVAVAQGQYGFQPSYQGNYQAQAYQPRPRSFEGNARILRSDAEVNDRGFHYAFETENGIQAEESGQEANGIQAQGSYSYTGDDGQVYQVRYTADANGFQAQGAHLPTPPPVPEAIARALAENARDEANGIFDDGIQAEESGQEANGIQAQGSYSYTGDDGQVYQVRYTADANGFQAQGAHLPTPPPVPEAIARALAENARDEANGIFDDGSYHESNSGVAALRTFSTPRYTPPQTRRYF